MALLRSTQRQRVARIFLLLATLTLFSLTYTRIATALLDDDRPYFAPPPIVDTALEPQTTRDRRPPTTHTRPAYKPAPTWLPPPITDPFPLLATSSADTKPPPIPKHNSPRPNLHKQYGLAQPPPLFIGFTRQWPILLQAVVSYITAGWPPSSIVIVENTGVHDSNRDGLLSLQNAFYLNHTTLGRLGVRIIQNPRAAHLLPAPKLLPLHRPPAIPPLLPLLPPRRARLLPRVRRRGERWALRWFQYDHLTLVNRAALDAVGGWDSLLPYYNSDCDLNARLAMDGWTTRHRRVGIINDVGSVMADLAALYRVMPGVRVGFGDPNPGEVEVEVEEDEGFFSTPRITPKKTDPREYFELLSQVGIEMGLHKYRGKGKMRNEWQKSQRGGQGEPYYYDPAGFARAYQVLTKAGRDLYAEKWGHEGCDLVEATGLRIEDQWRVKADWVK